MQFQFVVLSPGDDKDQRETLMIASLKLFEPSFGPLSCEPNFYGPGFYLYEVDLPLSFRILVRLPHVGTGLGANLLQVFLPVRGSIIPLPF